MEGINVNINIEELELANKQFEIDIQNLLEQYRSKTGYKIIQIYLNKGKVCFEMEKE